MSKIPPCGECKTCLNDQRGISEGCHERYRDKVQKTNHVEPSYLPSLTLNSYIRRYFSSTSTSNVPRVYIGIFRIYY